MSVLIKGMEMPNSCHECPLGFGGGCYMGRSADEYMCPDSGRAEWCPLVSVPPHGDLISREWLIDIALHLMNTAKNDDIANGVRWLWQYIIDAPTIIPAEEE